MFSPDCVFHKIARLGRPRFRIKGSGKVYPSKNRLLVDILILVTAFT